MPPDVHHLLLRFVADRATDAERARVREWVRADSARREYIGELAAVWDASGRCLPPPVADDDLAADWEHLASQMDSVGSPSEPSPARARFGHRTGTAEPPATRVGKA